MNELIELSIFNRITFLEKDHVYLIDGNPTNAPSVTRLLKRYKRKFDQDLIAARVAKKRKCPKEQVILEWELNNVLSTTLGTMVHKYIENYYGNKRVEFEGSFDRLGSAEKKQIQEAFPKAVKQFQNFFQDNSHLISVKNEQPLGDIDGSKVCGMCDLLCFNKLSGTFEILDFKTNKKMNSTTKWGNLLPPFDYMTEGEVNEYTIQLNCYKYFIEKYTSINITKLKLVWLYHGNENYQVFELPDIQNDVKNILTTSFFSHAKE
jgi:hypothetical protein